MTSGARARLLPIALVALTLVAGACSSSSSDRSAPSTPPTSSTAPAAPKPRRVFTLVSLNVLHGATCDDGAGHCAFRHRMSLLARDLSLAGCPDVVALEEVAAWWHDLLVARLLGSSRVDLQACKLEYSIVSPK